MLMPIGLDNEYGLSADLVVDQKINVRKAVFCISALAFVEQRKIPMQYIHISGRQHVAAQIGTRSLSECGQKITGNSHL